jgi:hypothetical protein
VADSEQGRVVVSDRAKQVAVRLIIANVVLRHCGEWLQSLQQLRRGGD